MSKIYIENFNTIHNKQLPSSQNDILTGCWGLQPGANLCSVFRVWDLVHIQLRSFQRLQTTIRKLLSRTRSLSNFPFPVSSSCREQAEGQGTGTSDLPNSRTGLLGHNSPRMVRRKGKPRFLEFRKHL